MSRWHVLEAQDFAGEELDGIEATRWPIIPYSGSEIVLSDGLSNPDGDELNGSHVSLLPKGPAWGTPDDVALSQDTWLWKYWRAVTEPITATYRDLWRVGMESTSVTIQVSLADWERDYGLPNACFGSDQPESVRRKWLRFKVISAGTITPGDYLNLAHEVGSSIVIEEPEFFELSHSELGGPDEIAGPEAEHLVIIWPVKADEYGFNIGESTFAKELMYDFDRDDVLECVFPDLLCVGYQMIFNYTYKNEFLPS